MACHKGFLLGPWLESAKRLARDKTGSCLIYKIGCGVLFVEINLGASVDLSIALQYEWNARTQITMWFNSTEEEASLLRDCGEDFDVLLDAYTSYDQL